MLRALLTYFLLSAFAFLHAQDSTRIIRVYDRTLIIPVSMQHVQNDTTWCGSGYITDGIDTLYYHKCMAIVPMCMEMREYWCSPDEDSAECAEQNAEIRRYNDSLRAEDPRIGKYNFSWERGDGCWYEKYSPKPGVDGYLALEISSAVKRHDSFLLSTTIIDADKQGKWRRILESISL